MDIQNTRETATLMKFLSEDFYNYNNLVKHLKKNIIRINIENKELLKILLKVNFFKKDCKKILLNNINKLLEIIKSSITIDEYKSNILCFKKDRVYVTQSNYYDIKNNDIKYCCVIMYMYIQMYIYNKALELFPLFN